MIPKRPEIRKFKINHILGSSHGKLQNSYLTKKNCKKNFNRDLPNDTKPLNDNIKSKDKY